ARQATAAANDVWTAKTAAVEAAGRSVVELREQLWSKLNDPTFGSIARVLVAGPGGQQVDPSALALADVPAASLDLYRRAAATCPGLSWTVLAGIGSIESNHGRSTAPGVRSGANFAGAMGPMQFLAATWAAYGVDGDRDGERDVYSAVDSVYGAAHYLCTNGAGDLAHLADALWAYNHAGWYVDDVLVLALRYGSDGLAPGTSTPVADAAALLDHPNVTLSPEARGDLLAGAIDPRVVRTLRAAATGHRIAVSVMKTGHSVFVEGTDRVSNHFYGRAVDIYAVDGAAVSASNQAALQLALAIMTTAPDLRPDEFGSPWPEFSRFPGAFSDAGHQDHLHLGWGANPS
ncbi:MAG: lytic transglycosylase domain-containing protein, partial [Actinomycetota bacterium]|nr:lytic transglycosylase domain-containing protein [Actinomycetota bacterium]